MDRVQLLPSKNEFGNPIFSVLVKRTYDIRPGQMALRSEFTKPFILVDTYYDHGDPERTTVKYESEVAPYKVATDVVVVGKAYAPRGRPVSQMDVSVEIAEFKKTIRVIGDRKCIYQKKRPPQFTDPIPFEEMEIRYEKAYGGKDLKSDPDLPFYYPRNPMGKGIAIKNIPEVVEGLPLPNLEDPEDLLTAERIILEERTRWNHQPLPQGFGWFQKTWYPRCSFAGSIPPFVYPEEVMREEGMGIVPRGQIALAKQFKLPAFDVRFNNGASLGLILPFLKGGEKVRIEGMTREGELSFSIPDEKPKIILDIGMGENELQVVIHTVLIRLEEMQLDLIWRGAHEYPGPDWLSEMKRLSVSVF